MFAIFLKTTSIFLLIFTGYLVRRRGLVDEAFNRQLSLLLMNVFYPALILYSVVHNYTLASLAANWMLPVGSALIMTIGWLVGKLALAGLRRQPDDLRRTFHFGCAINNYSFLPIMLVSGLWGEKAVAQVIFSSLGAELCIWTLGVQALTGHSFSRQALKNFLSMPILALTLAISVVIARSLLTPSGLTSLNVPAMPDQVGQAIMSTCQMLGQAAIPVSAIVCGCRMASLQTDHLFTRPIFFMVFWRLLVIPALAVALLLQLPMPDETLRVLLVIAVQPVALVSVTLSEIYRTDARFAAASVLVTHLACMATIPVWLHLLIR